MFLFRQIFPKTRPRYPVTFDWSILRNILAPFLQKKLHVDISFFRPPRRIRFESLRLENNHGHIIRYHIMFPSPRNKVWVSLRVEIKCGHITRYHIMDPSPRNIWVSTTWSVRLEIRFGSLHGLFA